MIVPRLRVVTATRLLPPSVAVQDIHTAVAIYVTNADAMRAPRAFLRDGMDGPCATRIGGIRLGITDVPFRTVDQFRFAVTVNIAKESGLGLDHRYDLVLLPTPGLAFGIHVENSAVFTASGMARCQDIGPTITSEVVGMHDPIVVRVLCRRIVGLRRIDLMCGVEVGPYIVVSPRRDIHDAVVIEVGCGGGPAVVEGTELLHAEAAGELFFRPGPGGQIFIRDVFEADFRAGANVESHGSEAVHILGRGTRLNATVIPEGADNIGIEQNFDFVPIAFAETGWGPRDGKVTPGGAVWLARNAARAAALGPPPSAFPAFLGGAKR